MYTDVSSACCPVILRNAPTRQSWCIFLPLSSFPSFPGQPHPQDLWHVRFGREREDQQWGVWYSHEVTGTQPDRPRDWGTAKGVQYICKKKSVRPVTKTRSNFWDSSANKGTYSLFPEKCVHKFPSIFSLVWIKWRPRFPGFKSIRFKSAKWENAPVFFAVSLFDPTFFPSPWTRTRTAPWTLRSSRVSTRSVLKSGRRSKRTKSSGKLSKFSTRTRAGRSQGMNWGTCQLWESGFAKLDLTIPLIYLFRTVVTSYGSMKLSAEDADEMLSSADFDGDGLIDYEEFVKMFTEEMMMTNWDIWGKWKKRKGGMEKLQEQESYSNKAIPVWQQQQQHVAKQYIVLSHQKARPHCVYDTSISL